MYSPQVIDFLESKTVTVTTVKTFGDFAFNSDKVLKANRAVISSIGDDISYLIGAVPTAQAGHVLPEKGTIVVEGLSNITALQFIAIADTGYVTISLYKVD